MGLGTFRISSRPTVILAKKTPSPFEQLKLSSLASAYSLNYDIFLGIADSDLFFLNQSFYLTFIYRILSSINKLQKWTCRLEFLWLYFFKNRSTSMHRD